MGGGDSYLTYNGNENSSSVISMGYFKHIYFTFYA